MFRHLLWSLEHLRGNREDSIPSASDSVAPSSNIDRFAKRIDLQQLLSYLHRLESESPEQERWPLRHGCLVAAALAERGCSAHCCFELTRTWIEDIILRSASSVDQQPICAPPSHLCGLIRLLCVLSVAAQCHPPANLPMITIPLIVRCLALYTESNDITDDLRSTSFRELSYFRLRPSSFESEGMMYVFLFYAYMISDGRVSKWNGALNIVSPLRQHSFFFSGLTVLSKIVVSV